MMKHVVLAVATMLTGGALVGASVDGPVADASNTAMEIVGEDIHETYASPSPYPGAEEFGDAQLIWSDVIHYPEASYVCPHFSRLELGEDDFVVVRSPDGSRSWRYEGRGVDNPGRNDDGFWGIHIAGDTAVVELWSAGGEGGFGYVIDRFARGFTREEFGQGSEPEAIIGADDSEWAPCYQTTEATVYDKSRAVARLLINGSGLCTGWLVGNEGHLMTNNHCISTQGGAGNTNYEFMAEGATCATNCWQLQCPGTIVTTSGTLIGTSSDWDYALVQLSVNPSPTYGYFTLRPTGGVIGERLYVPQHPAGWGKKIAVFSSEPADPGHPFLVSKGYGGCSGRPGPDMGYRADTQGGSSGSPVVSYDDHVVIGLHHCGSASINTGVPIELVIADLGVNLPPSAIADSGQVFADGFESGGTSFWSIVVP